MVKEKGSGEMMKMVISFCSKLSGCVNTTVIEAQNTCALIFYKNSHNDEIDSIDLDLNYIWNWKPNCFMCDI